MRLEPMSKLEEWNDKLQTMKAGIPESCEKSRKLYNDIADGITGKRRWEEDGKRVKAARALMLSDKLDWIRERCKKPEISSLKKKRRPKKTKRKGTKRKGTKRKGTKRKGTKRKGTKRKGTKRKGTKHHKRHVSKYNMMGGKRSKKSKKSRRGKKSNKSKRKQRSKRR